MGYFIFLQKAVISWELNVQNQINKIVFVTVLHVYPCLSLKIPYIVG